MVTHGLADGTVARVPFRWSVNLACWAVVGVLATNAAYLNARSDGSAAVWWRLLTLTAPFALTWALVTPVVFGIVSRLPRFTPRAAAVHGAVSLLLMVPYTAFVSVVVAARQGTPLSTALAHPFDFVSLSDLYLEYFVYWAIVAAAHFVATREQRREQELRAGALELMLGQSQLQALRAQLQPHFLFNTLNTVASLVRQGDRRAALTILAKLSELLRRSLDADRAQFVSLGEEVEFVAKYLEIERARFGERLQVEFLAAEDALRTPVPSLLLQPLVENAVRHGIANMVGQGQVRVAARRASRRLTVSVYNDGPPLAESSERTDGEGIGLSNTRERLRALFGDAFSLDIRNAGSRGVEVVLEIPAPSADGGDHQHDARAHR